MKITQKEAIRQGWDEVKSWNYKLKQIKDYESVVYAEVKGEHGEVQTKDLERIYFVIEGEGEFMINKEKTRVEKGDIITIPVQSRYDYKAMGGSTLKVLLFMELWDN